MLPLSPPPGYFKEINSIISKFIWNDKCPRIKLTTLQHPNSAGGLAVPNFELYYWSFQLKALHNWVDPQSTVSWRVIEADKVKPNRLQDILFTGTVSPLRSDVFSKCSFNFFEQCTYIPTCVVHHVSIERMIIPIIIPPNYTI